MSLANVSIVGNLAKEPDKHQFASGRTKTTLVVAVNSYNKVRKEKLTDYYKVETWDRLADLAGDYLQKGNQVAISGRLALERWVDRAGRDRITPLVQANQLALPPRLKPDQKAIPYGPEELVCPDAEPEPEPNYQGRSDDSGGDDPVRDVSDSDSDYPNIAY